MWSAHGESTDSVARHALTNKGLLCIWWNCCRILYKEYLKSGQIINSAIYCNMSIKVCVAITEKESELLWRKMVLFHQDNAWPQVTTMISWTIYKLEWDLMQHSLYSLDMAPLDFYLFFFISVTWWWNLQFKWGGHKLGWSLSELAHTTIIHRKDWKIDKTSANCYWF